MSMSYVRKFQKILQNFRKFIDFTVNLKYNEVLATI